MSVIVISACIGILFLAGLVALGIARAPFGRAVIYGLSFFACAAILLSSCVAMVSVGASTLVVPLGVPWQGAHVRLDALAAFFLVVVNLGGAAAQHLRRRLRPPRA